MENKSPFKLLDPYTLEDKDLFFGRDQEVDRLYDLVASSKLVLVYGPSGAGKTSLVQCGLAGRFKPTDWFEVYVRRRNNINRSLRRALKKEAQTPFPPGLSIREAVDSLFLDYLRPVYLVFDQFEELYILGGPDERKKFFRTLKQLFSLEQSRHLSVKVIIIMREEYIAHLYDLEQYLPFVFDQRLRVEPMNALNVRKVIMGSCERLNIRLRKPVTTTNKITENLSDHRSGIQLSYLQIYLDKLFQLARTTAGENRIAFSPTLVNQLGAIGNILMEFLDEQLDLLQVALHTAYPEADENAISLLLNQFASLEGTRKPLMRAEIASNNLTEEQLSFCLRKLIDQRIIRHNDRIYELSHDTLASRIANERDELQKNLFRIQHLLDHSLELYRERGALLSEDDLSFIQPYKKYLSGNKDFLELYQASRQQLKKEKDYLLQLYRDAEFHRREAERKQQRAETLNLTLQSNIWLARRDFNRAVQYALEAWKLSESGSEPLLETKQALTTAFYRAEEHQFLTYLREIDLKEIVRNLFIAPDEQKLLVFTADNQALLFTLPDGLSPVQSYPEAITACFSPDSKAMVISTHKGDLCLLNEQGAVIRKLKSHKHPVRQLAFLPDGRSFLSAGEDFTGLWSRQGQLLQQMLPLRNLEKPDQVKHLKVAPDGSFYVSTTVHDHYVYVQPMQGDRFALKRHTDLVMAIDISPDSQYIASVSADKHLIIWTRHGDYVKDLVTHQKSVSDVRFGPDSRLLITASKDNTAKVWNLKGQNLHTLQGHKEDVNQAFFGRDGRFYFTSSTDGAARIWNTQGKVERILCGHQGRISDSLILQDGKTIITASSDHTVKFWNMEHRHMIRLDRQQGSINYATFAKDSQELITAANDGTATIWNKEGQFIKELKHPAPVDRVFFQKKDNDRIFTLGRDKVVYVWNRKGELLSKIGNKKCPIARMSGDINGQRLFTLTTDRRLIIWDYEFRKMVEFPTHEEKVYRFDICRQQSLILTSSKDHSAAIWNFKGKQVARMAGHLDHVHSAFFNHQGDRVITASADQTARIWDLDGQCLLELGGHPRSVSRAFFSPDGNHILTQSMGYDIRLWNQQGELLKVLDGHTGHVNRVSFSPCGRYILSAGNDRSSILWNAEGEVIKKFQTHTDIVNGAFFSPDSLQFVTISDDGQAHLFFTPEGIFGKLEN